MTQMHRHRQVDGLVNLDIPLQIGFGNRVFEDLYVADRFKLMRQLNSLLGSAKTLVRIYGDLEVDSCNLAHGF